MLEPRIQQQLYEAADGLYQTADALTPAVAAAAQSLASCLTAGGKLMLASPDEPYWAQAVAERLWLGDGRERPPLAACVLPCAAEHQAAGLRAFHALAQPGDMLWLAASRQAGAWAQSLVEVAHERDLSVLLQGGPLVSGPRPPLGLADTDPWVPLSATSPARLREQHLLVAHLLCDAIDWQLLGDTDGDA